MTQPQQHWYVLPHGKLSAIDDGILTVVGEIRMRLMNLPRKERYPQLQVVAPEAARASVEKVVAGSPA